MAFEFDPAKDAINRRKHGISLSRAEEFDFEAALFRIDDREDYGEIRYFALGFLDAKLYSLTFTHRGENVRPISLRKASKHEEEEYEKNS